ncbi:cell adhesion molecule 3-like [Asterias rubens]|uniref:cell adhesion molecule 3-like n=1 Tax=Asterias rubens TaxID=7604 RepID=UPI0014553989|nr:cell adhesion molecule 3-like [Asterias rubens]
MKMASRWLYVAVLITTLGSLPLITAQLFMVEPRDAEIMLNDSVTMRCTITYQPDATVFWSTPGASTLIGATTPLENLEGRFSIINGQSGENNLVINKVLPRDSGPYVCIVIIANGFETTRFESETGTLRVVQVPESGDTVCWTEQGRMASVGDPISLKCASSDPTVSLTWFVGDVDLSSSPVSISPRGTGIETEFLAQSQTNLKTYTCQPNSGDYTPCSVTLEVQHPPVVLIEEEGVIETGLDARFKCMATGNPDNFAFIWHYNGYQVGFEEHSRFNRARLESSGSVLVLPGLEDADNNVTLQCEAVNALGSEKATHVINARAGKTLAQVIGPIILGIILGLVLIVLFLYFLWWRRQRIKVEEITKKNKSVKRSDSRRTEVPSVDTGIVYTQTVGGFGSRYGKKNASNGDLARSGLDLESVGYGPDVTNIPAYRATAEEEKEDDGALRPIPRKKSTSSLSSMAATNHPSSSTTADDASLISPKDESSAFTYHVNPHFEDYRFPPIESQSENDFGSDEKKEKLQNRNIEPETPDTNFHSGDDDNIISTEL